MTDLHATTDIQTAQPHAAAQTGIKEWHRIVAALDWDKLPDLLTETVAYHSPATLEPYRGKAPIVAILSTVVSVLQDFTYLRHFGNATGYTLEFSARVGDESLFGVDLVEFNAEGKITDLVVMMRPASVVMTLGNEIGKRAASDLQAPAK